ncbi:hypothetical protein RDV89_01545 [Nocardioides zeae]|uniref:WD40 repeat domain-containing protein n=1 Tax=Nocardioides imazamoxiresistens TaxID=3231893 RepID=A0ABU3PRA8_9ACTN|nr:hypothetical protein [Nocardioides zeae]MDT9591733.1 hypothetical protein [Nocardioides zeae]
MSTPNDDQVGRTLSGALDRRADDVAGASISLDAVRGRARRIRNRRVALAGGAAAAVVLAVAAPFALTVAGTDERPAPPAVTDTPRPDGTDDPDDVTYGQDLEIDVLGAEPGDGPTVPYTVDGVLRLPGGGEYAVPGEVGISGVGAVVPLEDGWLAAVDPGTGGEYTLVRLDPDGTVVEDGLEPDGSFVTAQVARDAGTGDVAWVESDGTALEVVVADAAGEERWRTPVAPEPGGQALPIATPLTITDGEVVLEISDGAGVRVVRMAEDGTVTGLGEEMALGASPSGEAYASFTLREADISTCSSVVSTVDGAVVWGPTCDATLEAFSPDGTFVLAGPANGDGAGLLVSQVLDARTGEVVANLTTTEEQGMLSEAVWESPTSFVVAASQPVDGERRYGLLRIDLAAGTVEQTVDVLDFDPAFDTGGERYLPR